MDDSDDDCLADRLPLADRAVGRKCSSALTDEQLRATLRSYLLSVNLVTATSKEARTHVEQKLELTITWGEQRTRFSRLCMSVTKAILKEREAAAAAVPVLQASTDAADDDLVVTRTTTAAQSTDADDVVVTSVRTREERDAWL
tara:strand:- start:431 stop:862 length:432 start_codon:yes stop_codon:yes gene_type:complete